MRALCIILAAAHSWGQKPPIRMERIGLAEGLSQSSVFCAMEDRFGFLWFGTANGLNKYDGYQFQIFTHDPKVPDSISNDWIFALDEDHHGHLWIGTRNGINRLDRGTQRFERYLESQVTAVLVDHEGTVWAGTSAGLYRKIKSEDQFRSVTSDWNAPLVCAAPVRALAEADDGTLYIGTTTGLHIFDPNRTHTSWLGRIPYPLSLKYAPLPMDLAAQPPIIGLRTGLDETASFEIAKTTDVLVVCVGEALNDRFDWGEISGPSLRWSMQPQLARHAGGSAKNRVQADVLRLDPGSYQITWHADDSHHPGSFNAAPPTSPWSQNWGITIWEVDHPQQLKEWTATQELPDQLSASSINTIFTEPNGSVWIGTNGGATQLKDHIPVSYMGWGEGPTYQQYSDKAAADPNEGQLVASVPIVQKHQHSSELFYLDHETDVLVTAVGEGLGQRADTAWIQNGHRRIWEMGQGRHAGGSLKNRVHREVIRLEKGSYVANVVSDESHDPAAWNAVPPDARWFYGIQIHTLTQDQADTWRKLLNQVVLPPLPSPVVNAFEREPNGRLWIGTTGGVTAFDGVSYNTSRHNPQDSNSLLSNNVVALLDDHAGNLWIGTVLGGIHKVTHLKQSFKTITPSIDAMRTALTYSFAPRSDGRFWVGSNQGVYLYDPLISDFVDLAWPCDDGPCPNDHIGCLLEHPSNVLWVGSRNGLLRMDTHDHSDHIEITDIQDVSLKRGEQALRPHISALLATKEGVLAGTLGFGLWLVSEKNEVRQVTSDMTSVSCIMPDDDGSLWVGSAGQGLFHLVGSTVHVLDASRGLSSPIVTSVLKDYKDRIWVGTYGAGLNLFHPSSDTFESLTTYDGLANNVVYGLLSDGVYLWMSTNRGLTRLHTDTKEMLHYTVSDGLQSNEFNTGAYTSLPNGKLLFGGVSGFTYFDPTTIRRNEIPPKTVFTSLLVSGLPYQSTTSFNEIDDITLSHKDSVFSVEFAAMDFTNPSLNKFRYRLRHLDNQWSDPSHRRFVSYPHLPAGTYQLDVVSSNSDGVWDSVGRSLTIHVLPPFWGTWWFRLIFVSLIGTTLGLWWRHRFLNRKRLQAVRDAFSKELIDSRERERRRLAIELHDGLSQTLMAIRTDLLRFLQKQPEAKDAIGELPEYVLHAIEESRNISHQLHPHVLDRLGCVKAIEAVLEKARHIADTEFSCDLSEWPQLNKEFEIHVYRLVQEAITNICRHAKAKQAGVYSRHGGNRFELEIWDDGCGFNRAHASNGLGLTGMAERMRLSGGTFSIHSAPNQGTRIKISMPLEGSR
ncbi:MAG: hypothetical protein KDC35_20930 [Acidobacteria bacterium]|nr:hypothetical protein [Acidobacteriota bacterium]